MRIEFIPDKLPSFRLAFESDIKVDRYSNISYPDSFGALYLHNHINQCVDSRFKNYKSTFSNRDQCDIRSRNDNTLIPDAEKNSSSKVELFLSDKRFIASNCVLQIYPNVVELSRHVIIKNN